MTYGKMRIRNPDGGWIEVKCEGDTGGIVSETDPTVPAWAKQAEKPKYTADEVGALSAGELSGAVEDALAQAKASGEFDGADGVGVEEAYVDDNYRLKIVTTDGDTYVSESLRGPVGPIGPQGPQGIDGATGASPTHSWDGTVLTVTSASGTSSADLKGDTGAKGDTGQKGEDGVGIISISIEEV